MITQIGLVFGDPPIWLPISIELTYVFDGIFTI